MNRVGQMNGAAMAQKVQTLFTDDLDGSEADGTVRFGLDSAEYELDLNTGHARQLREALAPYIGAARRAREKYYELGNREVRSGAVTSGGHPEARTAPRANE